MTLLQRTPIFKEHYVQSPPLHLVDQSKVESSGASLGVYSWVDVTHHEHPTHLPFSPFMIKAPACLIHALLAPTEPRQYPKHQRGLTPANEVAAKARENLETSGVKMED